VHFVRERTLRLVELKAPIQVLLGQASRLRTLERLHQGGIGGSSEPSEPCERDGWAREVALSVLVLARFRASDPRVGDLVANLEALQAGAGGPDWPTAESLEAESEARPADPAAAIGHFAFCALDVATGESRRTDQDDLYDIAERAFSMGLAAALGVSADADVLEKPRRAWWVTWLLELVPVAFAFATATAADRHC